MKKLLIISFFLPTFGFAQDFRHFSYYDIVINQVLENTASFIRDKNTPEINFRFYLVTKEPLVNWNEERFSKWQILEGKSNKLKQIDANLKIDTNFKINNYEKN